MKDPDEKRWFREPTMSMESLKALFSSKRMDWETPWSVVQAQIDYPFDLDVCSTPAHSKAKWYITPEQNGLITPWVSPEGIPTKCWMNPPYGREIESWIARAYQQSQHSYCQSVTALLPSRTDTTYFHEFILNCPWAKITFLRGRIKFVGAEAPAPFPSMIVRWKKS